MRVQRIKSKRSEFYRRFAKAEISQTFCDHETFIEAPTHLPTLPLLPACSQNKLICHLGHDIQSHALLTRLSSRATCRDSSSAVTIEPSISDQLSVLSPKMISHFVASTNFQFDISNKKFLVLSVPKMDIHSSMRCVRAITDRQRFPNLEISSQLEILSLLLNRLTGFLHKMTIAQLKSVVSCLADFLATEGDKSQGIFPSTTAPATQPGIRDVVMPFVAELGNMLSPRLRFLNGGDLSCFITCFGKLGFYDRKFLTDLADACNLTCALMTRGELVSVLKVFAVNRVRHEEFFSKSLKLLDNRVKELSDKQLADLFFVLASFPVEVAFASFENYQLSVSYKRLQMKAINYLGLRNFQVSLDLCDVGDFIISFSKLQIPGINSGNSISGNFSDFPEIVRAQSTVREIVKSKFSESQAWDRYGMHGPLFFAISDLGIFDELVLSAALSSLKSGNLFSSNLCETVRAVSEYFRSSMSLAKPGNSISGFVDEIKACMSKMDLSEISNHDILQLVDNLSYFPKDAIDPESLSRLAEEISTRNFSQTDQRKVLDGMFGLVVLGEVKKFPDFEIRFLDFIKNPEDFQKSKKFQIISGIRGNPEGLTKTTDHVLDNLISQDHILQSILDTLHNPQPETGNLPEQWKRDVTVGPVCVDFVDEGKKFAVLLLDDADYIMSIKEEISRFIPRLHIFIKKRFLESLGYHTFLLEADDFRQN